MPNADVNEPFPLDQLLRSVGRFTLFKYKWFSWLTMGSISVAVFLVFGIPIEIFIAPTSPSSKVVQEHVVPLIGLIFGSGGLGGGLRLLEQIEFRRLIQQQLLEVIKGLPDGDHKNQLIERALSMR
jgi:hypothetical protein